MIFLYAIGRRLQNGEAIKFGVSNLPEARLKELQTGHPHKLKLLGMLPSAPGFEAYVHRRLADYRLSGEWFRADGEALVLARAMAATLPFIQGFADCSGASATRAQATLDRKGQAEWDRALGIDQGAA